MTNYKVTLAYDGTRFAGYQVQPRQRTVQGVLQKALGKMTKQDSVHVDGSGRTDSGVHALGQVVSFQYPGELAPQSMLAALNSLMPLDIEILDAAIVPDDFHARYSAIGKRYLYRVARGRYTNPFKRLYTGHYPYPIKLEAIETALQDLKGTHDFTSFAASGGVIQNKVRTIYDATVLADSAANELIFEFYGDGFLYNMVRILVATLLEIGSERRPVHDLLRLFEVKDRQQARGTAPASGLYLKEVYYPDE